MKITEDTEEDTKPDTNTDNTRVLNVDEDILGTNVECMVTTHIDDIKGSGSKRTKEQLHKALCKDYGDDVKIEVGEFEHVGIKHKQHADFSIYAHQEHYVG